jgi:hypothetical protein
VAVTDRWAELQLCKNRDIWRNVFDSMSDIWHWNCISSRVSRSTAHDI